MSRKITEDDDPSLPLGVTHLPGFLGPSSTWLDAARDTVLALSEEFLRHWPPVGTATRLRMDCYSTASHAIGALGAALGAITSVERAETRGEHVEAPACDCGGTKHGAFHLAGCPAKDVPLSTKAAEVRP